MGFQNKVLGMNIYCQKKKFTGTNFVTINHTNKTYPTIYVTTFRAL